MDIGEILVLTLSVPGMCLLLLILVRVEEWVGEDTNDGWASRSAVARRCLLLPVRAASHIGHICPDLKHLAKLAGPAGRPAGLSDVDLTFKRQ